MLPMPRKREYDFSALSAEDVDDLDLKEKLILRDTLIDELKNKWKEATQKVSSILYLTQTALMC